MPGREQVAALLIDIEAQLRQLNVWQDSSPSEAALSSVEPFCIDTLSFTQWLQFIFLPTMYHLLESDTTLPEACGMAPMRLWQEAGLPDGVVNIIVGDGATAGSHLAAHAGIDKISFTGSTPVGKLVGKAALENMNHITLELGGVYGNKSGVVL